MPTIAMSGNDTIQINNRVFRDLATGTSVKLTFPTEIASVKTGKNGNSIYSLNETGRQADVEIHLIKSSADDRFLQNLLTQQQQNFAGFVLLIGQFIKKVGDGQGNVARDTYVLSGGVFTKQVEAMSDAEGNTDQSVSVYMLKFTNAPRVIS